MEIGSKIKQARMEAKFTQEQIAEKLGVSRQTISNWENEKSYPDIASVLKLSDLYNVSLDYLLKGEDAMGNSYVNYLDESTNVVKSRQGLTTVILIATYLLIWTFAIIDFWFLSDPGDAMGYSLLFFYFIMPITTLTVSLLIGAWNLWGKWKWLMSIGFGIMFIWYYNISGSEVFCLL